MAKYKKATKSKSVKMPMHTRMAMGAIHAPKGKVYLRDSNDRFFSVERDGVQLELKAGVLTEVDKKIADFLKGKYPYLEVVK